MHAHIPHTPPNAHQHHHHHTQAAIKSELLKGLVEEGEKSVVHKVCDTVSELAAELLDKGEWPELLPALQVCMREGGKGGVWDC